MAYKNLRVRGYKPPTQNELELEEARRKCSKCGGNECFEIIEVKKNWEGRLARRIKTCPDCGYIHRGRFGRGVY